MFHLKRIEVLVWTCGKSTCGLVVFIDMEHIFLQKAGVSKHS